jgi:hypothetical protein
MALSGQSAARVSAPALGWLLSPDGTGIISITGIADSPRDGQNYPLPATASKIWTSPDASAIIAQSVDGLWLITPGVSSRQFAAIDTAVSVAWDRSGSGFVVCQPDRCAEYSAAGAVRGGFETAGAADVLAYSASAGTLYDIDGAATWHRSSGDTPLGEVASGAFLSASKELWTLGADGRLTGRDANGAVVGSAELVTDALGLVVSADGNTLIAANASTAAVYEIRNAEVTRFAVESGIEGVWLAPGNFTVRLHESAKRPVAFWNGETGALGWMPAAVAAGERNQ